MAQKTRRTMGSPPERMANLLALRDGEMDPSRARRLGSDPGTARELAELAETREGLNALPDIQPDPAVWGAVQARVAALESGPRLGKPASSRRASAPFAMAAGLLVAVAVGVLTLVESKPEPVIDKAGSVTAPDPALEALYVRSRELETLWNGGYRIPDATERVYLYRIADLDNQLAVVEPSDGALNQRQMEQLWSRRVELLESLAEVRRARAVLQPAVY